MKYLHILFIYCIILFSVLFWFRAKTPVDKVLPVLASPVVVVGTGSVFGDCLVKLEDGDGNFFSVFDNSLCNAKQGQIIKR